MKVWFKRGLISLVVLMIVALVGVSIFLLTFDPNAYKSKLEEIVYQRYQRTLSIEGNIELSLFPRIGLAVQGVSLSDRQGESTFASLDSARFAVAIWPLLSNRLVVDHVSVSGFKAWVTRNEQGDLNFRDLVNGSPAVSGATAPLMLGAAAIRAASDSQENSQESSQPDAANSPDASTGLPSPLAGHMPAGTDFQIDIAGLDLKNGEIHLYDKSSDMAAHIVQLDVNTGRMTFDQAFNVALKGKLLGDNPVADATIEGQAVLKLNPERRSYVAQKLNVQVIGNLADFQAKTLSLKGNLSYDAYLRLFNASSLELLAQGERTGDQPISDINISLLVPQLKVDRSAAELQVEKLVYRARANADGQKMELQLDAPRVAVSPAAASGDPISGTFKVDENDQTIGVNVGMSGLAGNAWNLTFKELKMEGALRQGERVVQLNAVSPAQWDVIRERGALSALKGDIKIEDGALPEGNVEFPLIGSARLDLVKDELSTDINAVLQGSKLDFSLKAHQLQRPSIVFSLGADTLDLDALFPPMLNLKPAGESGKSATESENDEAEAKETKEPAVAQLDWAFLDNLDITGAIKSDEFKFQNLTASDFQVGVAVKDGTLRLHDAAAKLYEGSMNGQFSVDKDSKMAATLAFKNLALGPALQDMGVGPRLSGKTTTTLKLATQGVTGPALLAGLDGSLRMQIKDGSVRGLDVEKTLEEVNRAVRNVFSGQAPALATVFDDSRLTAFSSLDANLVLTQGQANVKSLIVQTPALRVTQREKSYLDLVNRQADVGLQVRLSKPPRDRQALFADVTNVTIPLRISGPFKELAYQVQWNDIASQTVKSAVKEGLVDLLNNAGVVDAIVQPLEAEQEEKNNPSSPGARLGDAIRGLIDK